MANYCFNRLAFESPEDLEKARCLFEGKDINGEDKDFTFNVLVPMPPEIFRGDIGTDRIHDPTAWYQWSLDNWGTKWDATQIQFDCDTIDFVTMWSEPALWLKVLAERLEAIGVQGAVLRYAVEGGFGSGWYDLDGGCAVEMGDDKAWEHACLGDDEEDE